jgi:xylulokinase
MQEARDGRGTLKRLWLPLLLCQFLNSGLCPGKGRITAAYEDPMKQRYIITLDIGSTRTKAALFDREGTLVARHSCLSGNLSRKEKVMVEACPEDWLKATVTSVRQVTAHIDGSLLAGLCIASEGPTLVALDKDMNPVYPAMLWMDSRATAEAVEISSLLGRKVPPAWLPAKALWLSRHEPHLFARIVSILQPLDFVASMITGDVRFSVVSDVFNAAPLDMLEAAGLPAAIIPPRVTMGELHGRVQASWASALGVPEGLPVIAGTGGVDAIQVILGTGTLQEGIVCDKAGTSEGIEVVWRNPIDDHRFFVAPHPLVPGFFHIGGVMSTTGKALEWFRQAFYGKRVSFSSIMREAGSVPPGAEGLVFLPYLMGERTPHWDEKARSVFFGLSLSHRRAHLARAVLEGVAFGIYGILELLKGHGVSVKEIRVAGGPARSTLWNRIKADVTGLPVRVCAIPEVESLGLAILAGKSLGFYDDIKEAASRMVRFKALINPRPAVSSFYERNLRIYENLYPALKHLYHCDE